MKLIDCIREIAIATDNDYRELICDLVEFAYDREINGEFYIIYYTTCFRAKQVITSNSVKDCIYYAATYGNGTRILKVNEDSTVESMF